MKKVNIIILSILGFLSLWLVSCQTDKTPAPRWSTDMVEKIANSINSEIK